MQLEERAGVQIGSELEQYVAWRSPTERIVVIINEEDEDYRIVAHDDRTDAEALAAYQFVIGQGLIPMPPFECEPDRNESRRTTTYWLADATIGMCRKCMHEAETMASCACEVVA